MCLCAGRGAKDVGISNSRVVSPLSGTRGVRKLSAAGDGDGIGEADGGLMLPVVLRPAPGDGISALLGIPQVVRRQVTASVPCSASPRLSEYRGVRRRARM